MELLITSKPILRKVVFDVLKELGMSNSLATLISESWNFDDTILWNNWFASNCMRCQYSTTECIVWNSNLNMSLNELQHWRRNDIQSRGFEECSIKSPSMNTSGDP